MVAAVMTFSLHAQFSWQVPNAAVLPTGDLAWQPAPYVYTPGPSVRYIDFAGGNDRHDGLTPATAWQHHPWDRAARGKAQRCTGIHTYVFKRGVTYRGALIVPDGAAGTASNLIQLTSDPQWGTGPAVLAGAAIVTNWQRGAHPRMHAQQNIWHADLPFAPRAVWLLGTNDTIRRLNLARAPNWSVSDPDDVLAEWWRWENPFWWANKHKTNLNDTVMHLGIDTQHLTGAPEDYVGGMVWSEWGVVMGAPYAARIEAYDPAQKAIAFQGPWLRDSQQIHRNNRYMLEDLPQLLDEPGEFWFDNAGRGGRLYVRLPDDADPTNAVIEAARHINLIEATRMRHVRISGLTFRCNNLHWDLTALGWQHRDVENAAIRLLGGGTDIRIEHCTFLHVAQAVRLEAQQGGMLDDILIADNQILHTDHGGIVVGMDRQAGARSVGAVRILRNVLREIGMRAARVNGNMAVTVSFPTTAELAGNIIERCAAAGLFVFGGKPSGARDDVPFSRILIHHNKVIDPLLMANDWGGIETWQGGPFYVYNNISGNPGGLMNWTADQKKDGTPRFGHAYYLDGSFKNYHFNNIAWGKNNTLGSKYANCAAFQEIISYQNTFFNNTVYKFVVPSRRQAPQAGRNKFLGNIFDDITQIVFRHSDNEGKDPNARDAGAAATAFAYETSAYADNVFHDITGKFAVFEAELSFCAYRTNN
jgi:hypothetical protein